MLFFFCYQGHFLRELKTTKHLLISFTNTQALMEAKTVGE